MNQQSDSKGLDTEEEASENETRERRYKWSQMTLDELVDVYWQDIAPERYRDGFDEDRDVPTYDWLTEHGYSGIAYALREHHDLTPKQFFVDVVGLEDDDSDEWEWNVDHEATVNALEVYLNSIQTRGGRAESTVETHRTRLAKWVRTYRELHETDALLEPLSDLDQQPGEIERCLAVLDVFDEELSTDRSKLEYLHVARAWYAFVKRRKYAKYNPLSEAGEEFGWEASEPDPQALTASQVRQIYSEVDSPEAELLVVALAGWGLRPSEVAALHVDQVVLDAEDPHLSFGDGERKNGPGEVTLLYGVDIVADRIDSLSDRETWNGYLFPSRSSSTGHVSVSTIRRRFKQLADTAEVVVDGDTPTPKMGRRFWYSAYQEAVGEVLEGLEGVAEDLAQEFVDASVKYFWPAIYRGDLEITVETPDEILTADVESVPAIRPFVEAYEERTTDAQSLVDPGDVAGLDIPVNLPPRADGTETPDGSVRLSARLASPADDDSYLNNVALFRGAGMVVKYYDQSRVAYGDRNFFGVIAAGEARSERTPSDSDREIDRFLRFAEPPEHDEWESTENLREQYQRGFRMALDDMFGTLRDGLRHLISKGSNGDSLSDNVLNRFPIHGSGNPRSTTSPAEPVFEIDSSSRFDGDAWEISGRIKVLPKEFDGWSADISLTGVGEDGSRYDDIPIDYVEIEQSDVTVSNDDGSVHLVADEDVSELSFSGRSYSDEPTDLVHGDVGATQLEILAELQTSEEDQA